MLWLKIARSGWTFAVVLVLLTVLAQAPRVEAVAIAPADPSFAWLFDNDGSAAFGGVPGTVQGGATFVTDTPFPYFQNQTNYALSFDGVSGRFEIPDSSALRPGTGAWTTAFWFKAADVNAWNNILTKRQNATPFVQWSIMQGSIDGGGSAIASKKISVVLRNSAGQNWWFVTQDDVVNGEWRHLTFARDASGAGSLYIDGALATLQQVALSGTPPHNINNTDPWYVGFNNGTNFYSGLVDEVAFWNSPLTASNALWLAENSLSPFSVQPPIIPEPSTLALLALGIAVGGLRRRRK